MKNFKSNFYLYLIIVILPVIIIGSYYFSNILKEHNQERKEQARWVASIYQKSWDQFIGETTTSLEILSLSVKGNLSSPEKVEPLLREIHDKDLRYGGLYLLDKNGKVLTGSELRKYTVEFSRQKYIQDVIKTKDTIISNHQEITQNNQRILGLATPVLDENHHVLAILVAHLRIDYMQNLMKVLTPKSKLVVVNGDNKPIVKLNVKDSTINDENNWIHLPMDRLPWNIKVKIANRNIKEIAEEFSEALFIILVITHVLFLLIEYILLRRHTVKERKQNEVQKLELVGTLAASTAHEIRNPLTGVKGLMQLLSEKYTAPEDQYYFEVIDSELNRINEIVSEFLILGKPTAQLTNNVNIVETLQELKPLIISEGNLCNVDCSWGIPSNPVIVQCVKDQIKQVVLNIAKNSFESMEGSGKLEIILQKNSQFCLLEIIDNGKGMSKEELDKIFRPFYTSKKTGTGLGLVVCKRIIQSFGGKIQILSAAGKGTKVEITLPLAKNT
ncbi:ATP-binding protein [Bacillus salipaludis]|uniref:ATP-binding protein n=1 Tax=Bacillus salipaludis TaxID=2547811 RepID=UPI003D19AEAB